jgi:antitoxin component YwqK of YwqJK toxin-antitoxin module
MPRPASWLFAAGLAGLIAGCGKDPTPTGDGTGTPDAPTNPTGQTNSKTTPDRLLSSQGALYLKESNTLFTGTLVDNWDAGKGGKQKYQCDYFEGQKHGVEMRWHASGQRSVRTEFQDGKQNGKRHEWHFNGAQKALTIFVNGHHEGEAKGWHDNGKQAFHAAYTNGLPVGPVESWWKNGNRASYLAHINGKPSGAEVKWFPNGRTNSIMWFQAGVKNGGSVTWHSTGQKQMELRFVEGEADGPVSEWYKTGQRMSVTQYVKGQMHGLGQGWYPDGKLLWRGLWDNDKRDKVHVSYYPSGRSKMEVEYRQGIVLKKFKYNELGQVVERMIVPVGRTRPWSLDELKATYHTKPQNVIQADFGKPDRVEAETWVYTGMQISGMRENEKVKTVLRVTFKNRLALIISATDR